LYFGIYDEAFELLYQSIYAFSTDSITINDTSWLTRARNTSFEEISQRICQKKRPEPCKYNENNTAALRIVNRKVEGKQNIHFHTDNVLEKM
jgi:hypothetical protein